MRAYQELLKEKQDIVKKINEAKELEKRLVELNDDTWSRRKGLISLAKQKEEEENTPIFSESKNQFGRPTRIVSVGKKWITLKTDGWDKLYRYKIENGWLERSRDGGGAIDVERALKIWSEHNEK
jgi:hypothetical protein